MNQLNVRPTLVRFTADKANPCCARITAGQSHHPVGSAGIGMLSISMTQKRQLALCLRNTVVGMTLSFILWQAWGAANDLASE